MLRILLSFLAILSSVSASTCQDLYNLNLANGDFYEKSCDGDDCTVDGTITTNSCTACVKATDGSYSGQVSSVSTVEQPPNSNPNLHLKVTTQCFQYGPDLYGGSNVCYESYRDGLGINSQCKITVDGNRCDTCQMFNVGDFTTTTLQFECSNLQYGDTKFEAVNLPTNFDEAIDGTLIRFLDGLESDKKCSGSGSWHRDASLSFSLVGVLFALILL